MFSIGDFAGLGRVSVRDIQVAVAPGAPDGQ